jgi:hypothetical protein
MVRARDRARTGATLTAMARDRFMANIRFRDRDKFRGRVKLMAMVTLQLS